MSSTVWDVIWIATPYVVGCAGLPLLGLAYWSLRWPSVQGRVEVSFLDIRGDSEGGDYKSHSLAYVYNVADREYAGANVRLRGLDPSKSDELNYRKYPQRKLVTVYYCPIWPGISCLERDALGRAIVRALLFVAVGIALQQGAAGWIFRKLA